MGKQNKKICNVKWEVLNPEAEYELSIQKIAPRLSDFHRIKIGLFWNSKPNGDVLLNAIGKMLKQRFKTIELVNYNLCIGVGPENIELMAKNCDGIIAAMGD